MQLSTLIAPETKRTLDELHHARMEEIETDISLAVYIDYLIRQEAKRQGLRVVAKKAGKRAK